MCIELRLIWRLICDMTHDSIKLRWQPDINGGDDLLVFEGHLQTAVGAHLNATVRTLHGDRSSVYVIPSMWELVIQSVKCEVKLAADLIISKLHDRFPANHVLNALSILGLFKLAIESNSPTTLAPFEMYVNPLTKLWRKLGQSSILTKSSFLEYFKLAEIAMVMVLGIVEDERLFNTVSFVKGRFRNRLTDHLPLVVRMFAQKHFTLQTMPFEEAIGVWHKSVKTKRYAVHA